MLRSLLRRSLEKAGFRVLEAVDGVQALEVFRAEPQQIQLVVLDYKMPRMDGVETLFELRKLDPLVRTILSSGYTEDQALEEHGDLGWTGFIQKPYQLEELHEKIRAVLEETTRAIPHIVHEID